MHSVLAHRLLGNVLPIENISFQADGSLKQVKSNAESSSWIEVSALLFDLYFPFAHQINFRLLNFSSASIFKVFQCCSKFVKMSECQTDLIRMRHIVTRRLTRIQAAYGTIVVRSGLRVFVWISTNCKDPDQTCLSVEGISMTHDHCTLFCIKFIILNMHVYLVYKCL